MDRYQDLARELKRLWKVETKVIPIVVGALGSGKRRRKELEESRIKCSS